MLKNFIALFALFAVSACSQASGSCRVSGYVTPRKIHRGMYVSMQATQIGSMPLMFPLYNILGNTSEENVLLSWITKYQFDQLALYNLGTILTGTLPPALSSFIQAAKNCGVTEINAVVATATDASRVQTYQGNSNYPGKFDGLIVEQEFWNASNVSLGFATFMSFLGQLQMMGITPPYITPYIGWLNNNPTLTEAQEASLIAGNSGRVFVHAYVRDPSTAYNYTASRVNALLASRPSLPIYPIFSAEGLSHNSGSGNVFMGDWLAANSFDQAEAIYNSASTFKPAGFQYYEYAFLQSYLK